MVAGPRTPPPDERQKQHGRRTRGARAARRVESELAERPAVAAAVRDTIGTTFLMLGRLTSAEEHLVPAWKLRHRLLGNAYPDTLASLARVALLRHEQGRLAEAERLYQRVLDLARLLHGRGEPREAEKLYRETLARQRRVLSDKHPHTLTTMQSLGSLLKREGRFTDAEPALREALDGQRRLLGHELRAGTFQAYGRFGCMKLLSLLRVSPLARFSASFALSASLRFVLVAFAASVPRHPRRETPARRRSSRAMRWSQAAVPIAKHRKTSCIGAPARSE